MAVSHEVASTAGSADTAVPRLVVRRRDFSHTGNEYIDGGWWPRSTDLAAEVGPLVSDAGALGLRVARLLYQLDEWPPAPPRRLLVGGTQVKLSGYRYQPKGMITLIDGAGQARVDLMVVPADCDSVVAARALRIAATDEDPDTGEAVLDRARSA